MLELPIIRLIKLNANSADSDKIQHYVASHLHVPTCMNNFETFFSKSSFTDGRALLLQVH